MHSHLNFIIAQDSVFKKVLNGRAKNADIDEKYVGHG
jgi:hypothetical protein